jgi:uncharacterized membrane protein YeiH
MEAPLDTPTLLYLLVLIGTALFALSGALLAARQGQTFVTMAFFALITGVGGGSLRDVLIGAPVFWIHDPWIAATCLAVSVIAWKTPRRWWDGQLLEYTDAIGLTAYAVLGTVKSLSLGVAPIPAMVMGVVTGCAGGIIRDMVAGVPSILMRPELYVTPAALSASLCAAGLLIGLPDPIVWTVATLAGLGLRTAALYWKIELPAYSRG